MKHVTSERQNHKFNKVKLKTWYASCRIQGLCKSQGNRAVRHDWACVCLASACPCEFPLRNNQSSKFKKQNNQFTQAVQEPWMHFTLLRASPTQALKLFASVRTKRSGHILQFNAVDRSGCSLFRRPDANRREEALRESGTSWTGGKPVHDRRYR